MKKVILFLFLLVFLSTKLYGEDIEIGEVFVTADRVQKSVSDVIRSIEIIDTEMIKNLKNTSITELLKSANIDLQERGPDNIQADLSIRGSTFSQVLVLLDGVRISDPQTAHHNLDIPLSLENIERIEILKGTASSLYGSSAFGGVVNIITKKTEQKSISAYFGENNFLSYLFSIPVLSNDYPFYLVFNKKTQDGWRENTQSKILTFSSNISVNNYDIFFGLTDKDFGASYFYGSPFDINAQEETKTRFLSIAKENKKINSKIFSRWHTDRYILDFKDPQKYINYHKKHTLGLDVQIKDLNAIYGVDIVQETYEVDRIRNGVDIGKLGKFTNNRFAIFGEYSKRIQKFNINIGARLDYDKMWGEHFSPQASLSYQYLPSLKIRTSVGTAFRAPSFTELYYEDKINVGNPNLKLEKSAQIEIGADYNFLEYYKLSTTFFYRDEKNIIDWIKRTETPKWEAENYTDGRTTGMELCFKYKNGNKSLLIGYTYLDVDVKKKYQIFASKYKLRYPRHHTNIKIGMPVGSGIFMTFQSFYKKRIGEGGYFISSVNLTKKIKNYEFFLRGTNLFNKKYEEISGAPQPGRLLTGGVKFDI